MASRISNETIDAIHESSDIVQLVGEYTKLTRRNGNDWWGCCPFHNEKTPSFHVDGVKKFYYCFGCHASGDVVKFVCEIEKLSYMDAIKTLAKRAGIEVRYASGNFQNRPKEDDERDALIDLYERISVTFHFFLTKTDEGKHALSYIKSRGISEETISRFKLGYAPKDRRWLKKFLLKKKFSDELLAKSGLFSKKYPDTAFFSNRLMFPIFNRQGKCVAFGGRILEGEGPKYLNTSDLPQYKKGETLYAFHIAKRAVREENKVIFCEGYMDCIAYHQSEIPYAVAPLGTALTENQLRLVQGFAETVLLSFDSDGAGREATKRAIFMCRKMGFTVKIIRIKEGKDPAEVLVKFGKEYLQKTVNSAIIDSDYFLSILQEKYALDTGDGKTKAALFFFEYVDCLQSEIQKTAELEKLSETFHLPLEAVKRDFHNRAKARDRMKAKKEVKAKNASLGAELRTMIAILNKLDVYGRVREKLRQAEFEDERAEKIFLILEECTNEHILSLPNVLSKIENDETLALVSRVISSGEFSGTSEKAVEDGVALLQKSSLSKKRVKLVEKIRELSNANADDNKSELENLIAQKMALDTLLLQ